MTLVLHLATDKKWNQLIWNSFTVSVKANQFIKDSDDIDWPSVKEDIDEVKELQDEDEVTSLHYYSLDRSCRG